MPFEDVIDQINGFGLYQKMFMAIVMFSKIPMIWSMMIMAFASIEPDWWCESRNDTSTNVTYINNNVKGCYSNGTTCDRVFSRDVNTIVNEWNLVCDKKWVAPTIISIQMAGVLVGACIGGHLADSHGRKKVLFGSFLLNCVCNIAIAFSLSWEMFAGIRFIIGISLGGYACVSFLYPMEFIGERWRTLTGTLHFWTPGMSIFSFLLWILHDWKHIHIATCVLTIPVLLTWFVVPESGRWLTVKGKLREAEAVLAIIARYNKKQMPGTAVLSTVSDAERKSRLKMNSYTYLDLFKSKDLVKKTTLICFCNFTCSVIYFAISFGIQTLSGNFYINLFLIGMIEVPACLAVIGLGRIFGRRWSCAVCFFLGCLASLGVSMSSRFAPSGITGALSVGLCLVATLAILAGWVFLATFTVELFPTVIRNLGYSASKIFGYIGGILASHIFTLGEGDDLMIPYLLMGGLSFLNAVACLLLNETSGRALEDTLKDFMEDTKAAESTLHMVSEEKGLLKTYFSEENGDDGPRGINGNSETQINKEQGQAYVGKQHSDDKITQNNDVNERNDDKIVPDDDDDDDDEITQNNDVKDQNDDEIEQNNEAITQYEAMVTG